MPELVDATTDLLQQLIRNRCVNDGAVESGHEHRNADLLHSHLEGPGLDLQTYEPQPGRRSLVARIEGSDPGAPSLMLMGHTDVVPANPDRWRRDPFGGELVDGVVWGRGAVDMLNLTASMAVAVRHLADTGFTPRGTLVYLAVADEEAGGTHGAQWLAEQHPDAMRTDYVVTEFGGTRLALNDDGAPKLPVAVAEKGAFWGTIRVKGVPGHGSMPLRSDNALVTGAEVVRRLAAYRPPAQVDEVWRRFVEGLELPAGLAATLQHPRELDALVDDLDDLGMARFVHACTHTTLAPTVMQAGVKTNVIPDTAEIDFDIRGLPGLERGGVLALIEDALDDLADRIEVEVRHADPASSSPIDTPLWAALQRHAQQLIPGARNIPCILPGATDSRFLRRLGATCYGYGAYSGAVSFGEFMRMFHGDDERIDQESLRLSTELWMALARDLLD
ncbi:MAG TPA: M20/M25/M40 family metallo-hydrolase [Nitriliruptorales bacterium]|nr:M20/M25/M40 family metallo-hydrolase [Nitriliruptorales bacterium]